MGLIILLPLLILIEAIIILVADPKGFKNMVKDIKSGKMSAKTFIDLLLGLVGLALVALWMMFSE